MRDRFGLGLVVGGLLLVMVLLGGCAQEPVAPVQVTGPDRLLSGQVVVLVESPQGVSKDKVWVRQMEEHLPQDSARKAFGRLQVEEFLEPGTRAVVLADEDPGGSGRLVRVRLSEGPYERLSGAVWRANLRPAEGIGAP